MLFQDDLIDALNAYNAMYTVQPPEEPNEMRLYRALVESAIAEALVYRDVAAVDDVEAEKIVDGLRQWAISEEDRPCSLMNCCDVIGLDFSWISRIILAILDADVETLRSLQTKFGTEQHASRPKRGLFARKKMEVLLSDA